MGHACEDVLSIASFASKKIHFREHYMDRPPAIDEKPPAATPCHCMHHACARNEVDVLTCIAPFKHANFGERGLRRVRVAADVMRHRW